MKNRIATIATTSALVLLAALSLSGCSAPTDPNTNTEATLRTSQPTASATDADESPSATATDSQESESQTDATTETEMLQYLIEEEKLAHDVYGVLYDAWGSKVFGNILESETTHQTRVAGLLDSFGVQDPRSSEVGVFTDPELQDLYDQLIAKGLTSAQDAFEVGVLIEEKDIADIQTQLDQTSDPDVVQVLESLLKGSQNHLAAFERQLP